MGRHRGRAPGFRQRLAKIGHALSRVAVKHIANGEREDHAVVIASAEWLVEEEVPGFLETRYRAKLIHATLDVRMTGLPVIDLDAIFLEHRIGEEQSGR